MNNIAPKAPLARQANQMAGHGRYGDSQLVHMNPYEVQGLASMSPTGQLTINPVTGQPEAFLPFLAPLIGSALGTSLLGGTALGMAGAGAVGAGLATWAESGSLEKGIISGVTGFGLGKILGAGADVANEGVSQAMQGVTGAETSLATANTALGAAGEKAAQLAPGISTPTTAGYLANAAPAPNPGGNLGLNISPNQLQQLQQMDAVGAAQTGLASARSALTPAQRMGGFTDMEGFKAMGKQALSPSSMLPMAVGMGTMASVEQQEAMDDLSKKQLGEDKAYAQEWQDVFDESVAVADRRNQRQGRMPSANRGPSGVPSNPYAGRYNAASGGIVGLNGGGEAFGAAQDAGMGFLPGETAEEAYARLGYIPYNSTAVVSDDLSLGRSVYSGNPGDPAYGVGAGSLGGTEGDQYTLTDQDVGKVITNTAAGVNSLVDQGASLENISAGGSAGDALSDAWADEMGDEIRGTTTGLDADNRYFVKTTPNSGAERQSFLRGDFKQKPPSDYRHGFEKEFQFFDYVDDRPIERYQDLFGAGPSDYMAGLLAGNTGNAPVADTNTLAAAGDFSGTTGGITNTAGGITNLETDSLKADCYTSNDDGTYTISKSDIYGVCPLGSYNTQAAADAAVTVDVVDGGSTVVDGGSTVVDGGSTVVDGGSTVVGTAATEHLYDAAGNKHEAQAGWTNSSVASYLADGELTAAEMASINNLLELSSDEGDAAIMGTFDAFDGSFGDSFQDYLDSLAAADDTVVDPLAAFGTDIDSATEAEVTSLVSMINSGATTIEAVASRYGTTSAAVQAYLDSLTTTTVAEAGDVSGTLADTAVTDPLLHFGTDIDSATEEEVASLVSMINSGATTIDAVASRYGTTAAAVQAYLDSLVASTNGSIVTGTGLDDSNYGLSGGREEEQTDYFDEPLLRNDALDDFGTDTGIISQEEIVGLVDLINSGDTSVADVAARYGKTEAEVQAEYDRLMAQRATNAAPAEAEVDPLADYEGIATLQTQEDINSLVDGVLAGDFTAEDIADRFDVDVNDVLSEIETITTNRDASAALSDYGTNTGIISQEEIVGLVDLINSGETSVASVAERYGKTEAEVQAEYDRLMAQRAVNEADAVEETVSTEDASEAGNRGGLIKQYITETFGEGPYTAEEAIQFSEVAIQNGVSAGEVAAALDVDTSTVQSFYDQVVPPVVEDYVTDDVEFGEVGVAGGGRVGTRRFMTRMGPVELADGGIADIPADGQFMQEMPPEVAMVQEALIVEEPPEVDYDDLVAMTIEAIKGGIEDADSVINMFIEEYGVDAFRELREAVLQSIVPNAQTEGMIAGESGGMADEVMGMIGEDQQVAVSPGEYIIAADVVSGLGDGNSDAGADVLDEMMQGVRNARSGGRQPSPIDKSTVMPA